ncbi:MAG: beta-ketoacyl-ACP synthase III [Pseudomonadota bacterium]
MQTLSGSQSAFRSKILGTGSYLPEKILTNADLEKIVETTDQWIVERSGIKKRHVIGDDQMTSDMAVAAAEKAIIESGLDRNQIDMILCATTTPDMVFPATAAIIQKKLNITNHCAAFDVQAVCAGFIFALSTADQYIRSGSAKNILIIGADAMTRLVDYTDRSTCVLFGDGAGAMILGVADEGDTSDILATRLHTDGHLNDILKCEGYVGAGQDFGYLAMEGKDVFKTAVTYLTEVMQETLDIAGLHGSDLDYIVPHQANQRIMDATAKKVGAREGSVISTIADHGNSSAASIPLAFDVAVKDGRLKRGHKILMEAIGGGMSWGGCVLIY